MHQFIRQMPHPQLWPDRLGGRESRLVPMSPLLCDPVWGTAAPRKDIGERPTSAQKLWMALRLVAQSFDFAQDRLFRLGCKDGWPLPARDGWHTAIDTEDQPGRGEREALRAARRWLRCWRPTRRASWRTRPGTASPRRPPRLSSRSNRPPAREGDPRRPRDRA